MVEDSERDAALLLRELQKAGYIPVHKRVDTAADLNIALIDETWDIIISDHSMPSFSSLEALALMHSKGFDLPFIIVSGQIGEDLAVKAMRAGAHDYIMKGNLKRLGPAIERELLESANRAQRRKAEMDLTKREEELRLSKIMEGMKDEFIGMVSHELKTPLTIIIGSLRVAQSEGITAKQSSELIQDAISSAESLAVMVDNLLELSRHQSKQLRLQNEKNDVKAVVLAVAQKFNTRSAAHVLKIELPDSLPPVNFDRVRIERVLYNLIENAIKYSPHGGEVRIRIQMGDGRIVFSVCDQGIGISPENQARLFQRFQRLDIQEEHNIAGVGLGLRVCRILVESHGGNIWVESKPGEGSTFFFTIPFTGSVSN